MQANLSEIWETKVDHHARLKLSIMHNPRMDRRHYGAWGRRAILTMVVGLVGLNILARNHAQAMLRFSDAGKRSPSPEALSMGEKLKTLLVGVNLPRPVGDQPVSDLKDQAIVLEIPSSDGVSLEAWYCDAGAEAPLVILFHGYSAEKTSLLHEGKAFLEMGCSVMLVDFRGAGGSSENYATLGYAESKDVRASVVYARNHLPHTNLVLYGFSMGAASILKAVNKGMAQPDAVIINGVFDRMLNTIENRFHSMGLPAWPCAHLLVYWGGREFGFNGFKLNPVDYAASLTCPALFMHGDDDVRATLVEARLVFANVAGEKQFHSFIGLGHESYIKQKPQAWSEVVQSFLSDKIRCQL